MAATFTRAAAYSWYLQREGHLMLRSFICSLLFATVTFAGTPKEFCTPAASDKDMNELAGQVSSAHERRPGDPAVLYYAAYVCAHSAQPEKAVVLLETMRSTGAG